MGYANFLRWAGKQGFKYGQKYLYKAWKEAEKLGKPIAEKHFPKLINKAKDYYKNFKTADLKVVPKTKITPDKVTKITPDKVTKIPTSYKTPPSTPKKEGIPIFGDPIQQQGLNFFRDLGKKQQGVYGPFGKGTDGFSNMMLWMMQNTPKKTMEVMKQYGYKPRVIPKMPPGKQEGGIMTVSSPGLGEGPFMMEEFLEAVKNGFKGEYEDYINQIDKSPSDYLAEGGVAGQDEIDKALQAIEKLKPSLMPESYEELIEIYKDKQKDLNIDIMEDAGGLGQMLGEGGRTGYQGGDLVNKWKIIKDLYDKVGGVDQNGKPISIDDFAVILKTKGLFGYEKGGRVGMMYGGDPGFAFSYGGSWADWKENHASEMPVMDYINQKLPKARNPFTDARYDSGGPVHELDGLALSIFKKPYAQLTSSQQSELNNFKPEPYEPIPKSEGGRIGFQDGTTMDLKYINPGFDKSEGMASGMGGFPLPAAIAGAGILALNKKRGIGDNNPPSPIKEDKTPQQEPPEDKGPDILSELATGEILQNLYKGQKGLQVGRIQENLIKKYRKEGMEFIDAIDKGTNEGAEIVNQRKLKIIEDKMSNVNIGSDAYVDLIDESIRFMDYDMYKDIKRWKNTRPDLADKTRALHFPDWAEARYGEDYQGVLQEQQNSALKQKSDEIDKMYPDTDKDIGPSFVGEQQMVDEIDEMNKANLDELLEGRKKNAEGGRIGFQEGTGIMSQTGIPYYADKAVEGIVNSAETLSKLPFAAGKLGSQLLQSPPDKKMFTDALENITPGSWSKNLGISSLAEAEGAKVSGKQRVIGDVLGLGTEMAVPVGGAFKIGQNLINQASKSLGKLKKGKTLDQTINDTITDFGQSRRDFNATVAASGLMVALKGIGLGGLFKAAPTKDFAVKLKTYFHNSDVDYGTSGMATFDLTALTAPVRTALKSIMNKAQKFKHGNYGEKLSGKEYINMDPGDAKFIVKELQKKGFTGKFTGIADEGGDVLKQAEKAGQKDFVKTYKKQSMKQNVKDHQLYNDYVVYENDPGFLHWNEATKGKLNKPFVSTIDEVVEILEPVVKKGEGGIIEDDEFREFLDDRKNREKDNFQRDFFEDFKKWKKWKEGNIQEAKDGGRMWQPKSAPQLTTTIPPESGPMPHGLTYLTGDDIVQNIGHKHGRN